MMNNLMFIFRYFFYVGYLSLLLSMVF